MILMGAIALVAGLLLDLDKAAELVNFGACAGFMVVNLSVIGHFFVRKHERGAGGAVELSFYSGGRLCRLPVDLAERLAAGDESRVRSGVWRASPIFSRSEFGVIGVDLARQPAIAKLP